MMTFFLHDITEEFDPHNTHRSPGNVSRGSRHAEIHTIEEKLKAPVLESFMKRDRLCSAMQRSSLQFPATLVCGRAGTGKTKCASDFVLSHPESSAWFSVDAGDADWDVFSHYFTKCLDAARGRISEPQTRSTAADVKERISSYLADNLDVLTAERSTEPFVIVLDDFHHLYDAEWFDDFFVPLLGSLSNNIHILMISRSKPPGPIWRLRSKQVLNVIDEKLLAFTATETRELYKASGLSTNLAKRAQEASFGRASQLHDSLVNDLIRSAFR